MERLAKAAQPRRLAEGLGRLVAEAAAEALWPTRCAVCDRPGKVLCEHCAAALPYIDWWRACRRCGSPYGLVQCDACCEQSLARMGRTELPYRACASAVEFASDTGKLVRVFKDQGEQRLAGVLAHIMLRALPPDWDIEAISYVPATLGAYRHRGFDHAQLLANELASLVGVPCLDLLARPHTRDQRSLDARRRLGNLDGGFGLRAERLHAQSVLLVDDVYTTGATLCAACDALHPLAAALRCLTFARV